MSNQCLVELKDVSFSWADQKEAILAIEFLSIAKGEHVFISGDSGSGKTTLLNLLCGIHQAQSGSITVLGQNLNQLSSQKRDSFRGDHLGVIFQQFNLLPFLSVKENIELPIRFSMKRFSKSNIIDDEIPRLLAALDLPQTLIDKKVTQLSVGQQQRVAACRALLGAPELIIADEPTSALDRNNSDNFLQLLFKEADANGSTIIFVSHDEITAQHFTRVVELTDINKAMPDSIKATIKATTASNRSLNS